jgi:hypothetical protein
MCTNFLGAPAVRLYKYLGAHQASDCRDVPLARLNLGQPAVALTNIHFACNNMRGKDSIMVCVSTQGQPLQNCPKVRLVKFPAIDKTSKVFVLRSNTM